MGFGDIFGHRRQIEVLTRAIRAGKLPHAYLFVGAEGIGKRLVALGLAQALQCGSEGDRPCGSCAGCRKTAEGNHPDVIALEPEGNYIKIEQVRELQKRLGLKPFEGKVTVCIIDRADRMNISAANALLKTLEEPPSATHLILLTANIRQVIPTVVSRCQRLKFSPLSPSDIEGVLIRERGLSREDAGIAARISEGSPGRAIAFLEIFPPEERSKLTTALAGPGGIEDIFIMAEELTKKENSGKLMETLEIIKFLMRDMALAKIDMKRDRLINLDKIDIVEREARRYSLKQLIEIVESVSRTETAIMMNANKRLAVDNMLLDIFNRREGLCKRL